jgi:hypothetical protein
MRDDCVTASVYIKLLIDFAVNFERSWDHRVGSVINFAFYCVSLISLVLVWADA